MQKCLMTIEVCQIVVKIRASHEFGKLVGSLTPNIQAMGYDGQDEDLVEAAFQSFQHEPIKFHILSSGSEARDGG